MLPYCNRTVAESSSGKISAQVCPRISLKPNNRTGLQIIKLTFTKVIQKHKKS